MKERRSAGWWPSSVPSAARRVSWWARTETSPPLQRPASLVIVHCGPASAATPASPPVARPSCSPPPPPPRSPAASSYATADEDESPSPVLEASPEGDLLQGILAIIEKKSGTEEKCEAAAQVKNIERPITPPPLPPTQILGSALPVPAYPLAECIDHANLETEPLRPLDAITEEQHAAVAVMKHDGDVDACETALKLSKENSNQNYENFSEIINQDPNITPESNLHEVQNEVIPNENDPILEENSMQSKQEENIPPEEIHKPGIEIFLKENSENNVTLRLENEHVPEETSANILADVNETTQNSSSIQSPDINTKDSVETKILNTYENNKREHRLEPVGDKNCAEVSCLNKSEDLEGNNDMKNETSNITVQNDSEVMTNNEMEGNVEEGQALEINKATLAKPEDAHLDDDSSGAGPGDTLSSSEDEDHDMTLDDATDITLDDDSTGSAPIARETAAKTNEEDEYFELARTSHYESVEFKRRPNASLISKRRLQALHPPRLGVVKSGLSRAWVTMRVWGSEGARKLGEWARDSTVIQDEGDTGASAPTSRAVSEQLVSPETTPPPPPMRQSESPPRVLRRKSGLRRSMYLPHEGQSGFDELRRYMKQGGDFCKELSTILQERADAEAQYAKCLSKLSAKLSRSAKEAVGTVSSAWQQVAIEMEAEGEAHKDVSAALSERVVRPLRATMEAQHRVRKSVETAVDKTGKGLAEWRVAEAKSKKHSFSCARENEKLQDSLQEAQRLGRAGRAANFSDKEITKLESKRRKAEESVKKADVEYYTFCIRAERARLEWETAVSRGSQCFQELEDQRLSHLKELVESYLQLIAQLGPKIVQSAERLTQPVQECDVARDLHTVASVKGVGQPIPEQLLPDFYPEHVTLAMNRERRRLALAKLLQLIRQDLDRERRAKQGVENLARALQQTPTFGTEDSQQNVSDKLHHMRSMLTYLEAARYKVHGTLTELDGQSRSSHPLAPHIQVTRDRQGFQQSILKVPPWVREESLDHIGGENTEWPDRGAADGNSVQPDSDFDEFSSQASDEKEFIEPNVVANLGQCRALYDYTANLCDELNLRTGDIISVREKQEDGWWLGELNGIVGIFPATYVEEVDKI